MDEEKNKDKKLGKKITDIPADSFQGNILAGPVLKQQKFQPTQVGIIYEEISLLDSFNDAR